MIYKEYVVSFSYFCRCFGSKFLYEMNTSAEQKAVEMDAKDGLRRVDSV